MYVHKIQWFIKVYYSVVFYGVHVKSKKVKLSSLPLGYIMVD